MSVNYLVSLVKFSYLSENKFQHNFNPFRTAKPATNGNHRLFLKSKPQAKSHSSFLAG